MHRARTPLLIIAIVAAGLCASFALAYLREPQSIWLWRDMLGIL